MTERELYDLVSPNLHYAYFCLDTPSKGNHMQEAVSHMEKVLEHIKTFVEEHKVTDRKLSEYVAAASKLLDHNSGIGADDYLNAKSAYKILIRIFGRATQGDMSCLKR